MSVGLIDLDIMNDIANAINTKLSSSGTMTPSEMATNISSIHTSSEVKLGAGSFSSNGVYPASSDNLDGYSTVTVSLPLDSITVTENKTYYASSYNLEGFNEVVVDTSVTILTNLNVNTNSVYTASAGYGYDVVSVDVPNTYSASDEGKVVSNGVLSVQTSSNITANTPTGTYIDTTTISQVTVDVATGGGGLSEVEGSLPLSISTTQNHVFNYQVYGKNVTEDAPNIYNSSFKKGAYNINTGDYESTYTSYLCSNVKVPVSANTQYIVRCSATYDITLTAVYYDATGAHIGHSNDGELSNILTFTTPANCTQININLNASNTSVQPSSVSSLTLQQAETNEIFDSSTVTLGYTFDSTGAIQSEYSSDWYATDYMPISIGKFYELTGGTATNLAYNVFFDINKNVIGTFSCSTSKNFVAPQNGYVRCSIYDPSSFSIREAQVKTNVTRGVGTYAELDNYQDYSIPLTCNGTNVSAHIGSSLLRDGDYIDYGSQQRVNSNSTTESIILGLIPTASGSNTIDTALTDKPEKVKISYIK